MKLHNLKSTRHWFDEVVTKGKKPFEIRKNDRDYQHGDAVVFWEVTKDGEYTGIKSKPFIIDYVVTHEQYPDGIAHGYCVFGIMPHAYHQLDREMPTTSTEDE